METTCLTKTDSTGRKELSKLNSKTANNPTRKQAHDGSTSVETQIGGGRARERPATPPATAGIAGRRLCSRQGRRGCGGDGSQTCGREPGLALPPPEKPGAAPHGPSADAPRVAGRRGQAPTPTRAPVHTWLHLPSPRTAKCQTSSNRWQRSE